MDNAVVLFLLRAIHIVGGVLWVGGVVVVGLFLLPATQAVGPAAQPMMQFIMGRRKLPVYLMSLGVVTTLGGLLLFYRNVSLTGGAWARSPMGVGISASLNSRSTIMHFPRLRRAAGWSSVSRAMARSRPAIYCWISAAAGRYFPHMNCGPAIYAPIPATAPQSKK